MMRAGWLLALGLAFAAPAQAAEKTLAAIPFWAASAGWWQSENTYFNGQFDYNIRAYNSIVHIALDGRRVTETEYKFYAPSKLALAHGAGQTKDGEGVEVITTITYEQTDGAGTVRQVASEPAGPAGEAATTIHVLNADTAQRVSAESDSKVDLYRMLISLPTPDRRYVANYGIVNKPGKGGAVGDLRGFSTFRASRIAATDFDAVRAQMRLRNKVHAVVTAGADHKPVAKRLD